MAAKNNATLPKISQVDKAVERMSSINKDVAKGREHNEKHRFYEISDFHFLSFRNFKENRHSRRRIKTVDVS